MSEKEPKFTGKEINLPKNIDFTFTDLIDNFRDDMKSTLQLKYPRMDWQMNKYMERADEGDPTCVRVNMDDGRRIDFSNNPEQEEVIFTYGLCGCIATCLVLEMKDGTEKAILTHSSPLATQMGSATIRRLGVDINPDKIEKAKVFILAPGEYRQNSEGKWEQKIKQQSEIHVNLETSAKLVGGANTEVERIGYSETQEIPAKNQGTFRIVKYKDGRVKFIVEDYYPSGEVFS
jgi:hypothetical protein